jgi:predicted Zn-dependent peptidase
LPVMNLQEARLSNGLRIVGEVLPTVQSVTFSIWSAVGSRQEAPHQHGMAHFLEHMLFKGTPTRDATEIARAIEGRGGVLNASTGKELTFYYARMLSEHLPIAVEVLSDMFLNARLDPEDIEREKGVILEEMKMIEDDPAEYLHDLLQETHWQGHPLGRRIIGTPETVSAFTREMLREFIQTHYHPQNTVIACVGNFEFDALVSEVERWLGTWHPNSEPPCQQATPPMHPNGNMEPILVPREVEQVHFAIGVDGVSFRDERRYALAVLNTLLGGSMFSRLWQEVREKRGLAYEIGSYAMPMSDGGMFVIYGGTAESAFEEVLKLVNAELERLMAEPPDEQEVESAKNLLKGGRVLALESTQARAELIGSETLMLGQVRPMEEILARIDAVSATDLHTLAQELLPPERRTVVAIVPGG